MEIRREGWKWEGDIGGDRKGRGGDGGDWQGDVEIRGGVEMGKGEGQRWKGEG